MPPKKSLDLDSIFALDQEQDQDEINQDQDTLGGPHLHQPGPEDGWILFVHKSEAKLLASLFYQYFSAFKASWRLIPLS